MELLPDISIFQFNNNTLNYVRKQYGLENKEILEDSIDLLAEWIRKQEHFMRKDFSREYLERLIIFNKGSLEKSKLKLDKLCTFRTLLPLFFQSFVIENSQLLKEVKVFLLPKMTKDHHRVFVFKNSAQRFDRGFLDFYRYTLRAIEFVQAHDYCTGLIGVFDYSDANIMEVLKTLNLVELQQVLSLIIAAKLVTEENSRYYLTISIIKLYIFGNVVQNFFFKNASLEGYGMRIKGIYFTNPSKAVDILLGLVKQVVSSKIGDRIKVYKSIDCLYDIIPKEMLPSDYGGKEKSIDELQMDLTEALFSSQFNKYFDYMSGARTNEALRSEEKFNNQCMGMPGSFRKLNVD